MSTSAGATPPASRRRRAAPIVAALAIAAGIAGITQLGLSTLSTVRACVAGEGLWSKAQKDAVTALHRYAESGEEADFQAFEASIAVPVGDRVAREELSRPRPDFAAVDRAFVQGRNDPRDVRAMAHFFRRFRRVDDMRRAIGIWTEGDVAVARLIRVAAQLHAAVQSGAPRGDVASLLARVDRINTDLTPLENAFSATLGAAARATTRIVLAIVIFASLALVLIGGLLVRRLLAEVTASERRYRTILETARDGILSLDEAGRIRIANEAAAEILGAPAGELVGREFSARLPDGPPDGASVSFPEIVERASAHRGSTLRLSLPREGGEDVPIEVSLGELQEAGEPVYTGVIRDIRDRVEAERTIARLAYHDALTGLPNRALFSDRLGRAIARARRSEEAIGVLFLDLDDFKRINDSLGHTAGDHLLREVASRLSSCVREQDTIARLGGDDFILLLQNQADALGVAAAARSLLEAVARPVEIDGESLFLTASIGISLFPGDGGDVETLLRNADTAMYRAKARGAGVYEFFKGEMNAQLAARRELEQSLHRALERNELALVYQPIWNVREERIVGAEALLRWNHPERGWLTPDHFISVAESSPIMVALGEWVLESACAQFARWTQTGTPIERVSVNVSPRQLQHREFPEAATRILEATGVAASRLDLEITETAVTRDPQLMMETLASLRRLGMRILMDDFGSGTASIGQLRAFPVDVLKIDRCFIDGIHPGSHDALLVRAIIEMARGLNLRVIAEGIETREQLDFLRRHGCEECQGFLLSPPLSAEELEALLAGGGNPRPPA